MLITYPKCNDWGLFEISIFTKASKEKEFRLRQVLSLFPVSDLTHLNFSAARLLIGLKPLGCCLKHLWISYCFMLKCVASKIRDLLFENFILFSKGAWLIMCIFFSGCRTCSSSSSYARRFLRYSVTSYILAFASQAKRNGSLFL